MLPPDLSSNDECKEAWSELLRSQRALLKQQFGDDEQDEPTLSEPQLEIELQRILASLEEEESRWRTAAAANERYWVEQAEAMFARWRLDDDARRREQQMHASSEAQRHEVELAELRPAPCAGWANLLRTTQLGRVGAPRVAQLCAECGREEANGGSSSSMRAGGPWSPATISAASVRKLLSALRLSGASDSLDGEPLATGICNALCAEADNDAFDVFGRPIAAAAATPSNAIADDGSSTADTAAGGDAEEEAKSGMSSTAATRIHYVSVLIFLLALVDSSSPSERLILVLNYLLPKQQPPQPPAISGGAVKAIPLTSMEQRYVYSELSSGSHAALSAVTNLSRSMAEATAADAASSDRGGSSIGGYAAPADEALRAPPESAMQMQRIHSPSADSAGPPPREDRNTVDSALEQRPITWRIEPPDGRAFAIWCATSERSTIGAALVGCCEPQKKMSRKQQLQLLQHEQQASFGSLAELS